MKAAIDNIFETVKEGKALKDEARDTVVELAKKHPTKDFSGLIKTGAKLVWLKRGRGRSFFFVDDEGKETAMPWIPCVYGHKEKPEGDEKKAGKKGKGGKKVEAKTNAKAANGKKAPAKTAKKKVNKKKTAARKGSARAKKQESKADVTL